MVKKLLFLILITGISLINYANAEVSFLRVQGNTIVNEQGQVFVLKGFNLTNGIFSQWNDRKREMVMIEDLETVAWALTEEDVKKIKETGANVVRYCINAEAFNQANKHFENNVALFNMHLEWFRKNNIYVVLNLHIPPGHTNAIRLKEDSIFESKKKWQEFESFWTYFLNNYEQEAVIAGWEFFNEPLVPIFSEGMSKQLETLEERITWMHTKIENFLNDMRAIDRNHIFFVCNLHATIAKRDPDGMHYIKRGAFIPFEKYPDDNIVYTFHFYEPQEFTHQGFSADLSTGVQYPIEAYTYESYITTNISIVIKEENGWYHLMTPPAVSPSDADYGIPVLFANKGAGQVYYDDVRLFKIKNGKRVEIALPNPSFYPRIADYPKQKADYEIDREMFAQSKEKYLGWNTYFSGKYTEQENRSIQPMYEYSTNFGRTDAYCVSLTNIAQEIAQWNTESLQFCIKPEEGVKYQIEGWVKLPNKYMATVGIAWFKGKPYVYNKNNIQEFIIKNVAAFSKEHNVPLFVSEFGSISYADIESRKIWTRDVIQTLKENNISFTYFSYKELRSWEFDFSLYLNEAVQKKEPHYQYQELIDVVNHELRD